MKTEENVYGKSHTEEIAVAKSDGKMDRKEGLKDASAVLGKFKDVDALAQAYGALQAEFTRRSQRLKELERAAENFGFKEGVAEGFGAEKLRKNAEARKTKRKAFDEFVLALGRGKTAQNGALEETKPVVEANLAVEQSKEKIDEENADVSKKAEGEISNEGTEAMGIAETQETNAEVADEKNSTEKESLQEKQTEVWTAKSAGKASSEENRMVVLEKRKAGSSVAEKGAEALSSEELYAQASNDEKVRLRIIGEYLASLGKTGAPLTTGNGGTLVSPPLKARSIGDAGSMALRYFKKSEA